MICRLRTIEDFTYQFDYYERFHDLIRGWQTALQPVDFVWVFIKLFKTLPLIRFFELLWDETTALYLL